MLLDFMDSSVRLVLLAHLSQNIQMSIVVLAKICLLKLKILQDITRVNNQCRCVNINAMMESSLLKIIQSA